jgi:hypothetical protein
MEKPTTTGVRPTVLMPAAVEIISASLIPIQYILSGNRSLNVARLSALAESAFRTTMSECFSALSTSTSLSAFLKDCFIVFSPTSLIPVRIQF